MRMTVTYCDGCGVNIGDSGIINLLDSRTFTVKDAMSKDPVELELTLCSDCKEQLYYILKNPEAFKQARAKMRLPNRIRFLLGMPMKEA